MKCESCGVILAKAEKSQNVESSPFSMLRKTYLELGHQHMKCPSNHREANKKKDDSNEDSKKTNQKNYGKLTIDDLYERSTQKRPAVKIEVMDDKGSSKNSNKKPPSLMRRKSSQLFIAFKTMNFLNGNKKSDPDDVTKE